MSVKLRNIDNIKFNASLSMNFTCEYSEDDRIFIISDTGVYILALKGYMNEQLDSYFSKNSFFKVSSFAASANVGININSFHKDLEISNLYEATMSTEYSINLNNTTPIEASPISAEWSPRGIIDKIDCLLAVLTNLNSLEVFVKYIDENEIVEYCMICNVTQEIINATQSQWKYADRLPPALKLNELKKRVQSVSCTAFTWTHIYKIKGEECCSILVGHLNGDITVWRLTHRPRNSKELSKLHFLGRFCTQLQRIVSMKWHHTENYGGGLSFADSDGKMSVSHIKDLDQENAVMDNELAFWTEADNVAVNKITVMSFENRTFIVAVKERFLVIYGLDESGKVFDQNVAYIDDHRIAGIHHYGNVVLVLRPSYVLEQFKLSVTNGKIRIDKRTVRWNVPMKNIRAHGFFSSKNKVMFGVIAYASHLCSSSSNSSFLLYLYHNTALNPLTILWNNPSGSLRDYWDCFQMQRLLSRKDKQFPWLGLPADLNYDNLSLLRLKTLRWLAKISEKAFSSIPFVKTYDIKPYIILHYLLQIKLIVRRLSRLLSLPGKELSVFQMRSINVQNFFLKEMVVMDVLPKANVGENFIREITRVMRVANELRYPPMPQCVWCGEKIIGTLCLPPHADSRCAVSMMPIFLTPSYKCSFCKALAHSEIEKEEDVIYCPYCDIPMDKLELDDKKNELGTEDYKIDADKVTSACFDDCLKEETSFDDLEENERDFVILTDSDEESEDGQNKLRTLYARLQNMSLKEIMNMENEDGGDDQEAGPSRKVLKLEDDG